MSWMAVAVGGSTLVSGILSSNAQSSAANTAAGAQTAASQAGIAEQQRQFDAVQKLLSPFASAGTMALSKQQDLLGTNGRDTQQAAIDAIKNGAQYQSMVKTGENSILANASATGGLRGGNTEAALAQFSPSVLNSLINDQYTKLGGLTSIGQNAAAGVGNAGMSTGNQVTSLLGQIGSAQAGNAMAQGKAEAGYGNSFTNALGAYVGAGSLLGNNAAYLNAANRTQDPLGSFIALKGF